ncbi:hypothetical protein ACPF64_00010 (plasmid) [Acinetobacter sp. KB005]|uniref:hypothetical protein n=1 Tax=Acinetobacter sp. KB005 TaxID=3416667 RepID=UPI003CF0F04C
MEPCDDESPYVIEYSEKFAEQWTNFPLDIKGMIKNFIDTFRDHGLLDNFNQYEGKISHSWRNCLTEEDTAYARSNNLWHVHIGYPEFEPGFKYSTSDWVLHFVWDKLNNPNRIVLVDCYSHETSDGKFYLPDRSYLVMPD